MRIKLVFLFLFVSSLWLGLSAQEVENLEEKKLIIQDARIDSLVLLHRKAMEVNLAHEEHDGIVGYRIQIFFDSGNNSKNRAIWIKDQFDSRYSNVSSYIIFKEPYYRIRVGDFRTKLEAEAFLKRISRRYSNAFVIQDKIKLPKLLNN